MDHLPQDPGIDSDLDSGGHDDDPRTASAAEPLTESAAEPDTESAAQPVRADPSADDVDPSGFAPLAFSRSPSIENFPPPLDEPGIPPLDEPGIEPPLDPDVPTAVYALPQPQLRPTKAARSQAWIPPLVAGFLGSALTVGSLWLFGVFDEPPAAVPVAAAASQVLEQTVITAEGQIDLVAAIAAKAVPSIVTVEIGSSGTTQTDPSFFRDASGSGVVFRADGYILTNNHVVEGAQDIRVILSDGRVYDADVRGTDPLTDVAVLHIDAADLIPITAGDPATVDIGELAVAVGNPLGLRGGPSVTSGIVSALGRSLDVGGPSDVLYGLVQTDAPITRGSSGGALLNHSGELIGITTAIGTSGIAAEGLGFAVPIDMVDRIASDLIDRGSVDHAFLGLFGSPAFNETSDGSLIPVGARIESFVSEDSAIFLAGAESGDIITAIGGVFITEMDQLVTELRTNYRAEQEVELTILRGNANEQLLVTLDRHPESR